MLFSSLASEGAPTFGCFERQVSCRGETDQRKLVAAIIRWLEQCVQPWLLIFDNADDLSFIPSYLPAPFTSRFFGNGGIAQKEGWV